MKDFEQVDVFIPDDPLSKDRMKFVYNVFVAMIQDIIKQITEDTEGELGVYMRDYVPDKWYGLASNYALKVFQNEGEEHIVYMTLCYVVNSEEQKGYLPLVSVNVFSGDMLLSYDCDCAAYIFMTGFVNHLGMVANLIKEKNEKES